jgi:hypothetical protein
MTNNEGGGGDVYRLIVPYAAGYKDIGDFLCAPSVDNNTDYIMGKYTSYSSTHVFSEIEKCSWEGEGEVGPWPFKSSSRLVDFTAAVKHMEREIMLRDPLSGLNRIQEFLIDKAHVNTPVDELFAVAAIRFNMPISTVKLSYELCAIGNRPPMFNSMIMGAWPVPNAVVNGPYPLSIETVRKGIISSLDYGTVIPWDNIPAHSNNHEIINNTSTCSPDKDGIITKLPYGVTPSEFAKANPEADMRTAHANVYFDSEYAKELTTVTMEWDPEFRGQRFETISSYMRWWIDETFKIYQIKRAELAKEASVERLRRKFLKEFYEDNETRVGPFRKLIRKFKDEAPDEKRARIDSEYEGHHEFLDLPVAMIDQTEIIIKEYMSVPVSTKDMWIDILKKQL